MVDAVAVGGLPWDVAVADLLVAVAALEEGAGLLVAVAGLGAAVGLQQVVALGAAAGDSLAAVAEVKDVLCCVVLN